mgnify:CR=1 FL=1
MTTSSPTDAAATTASRRSMGPSGETPACTRVKSVVPPPTSTTSAAQGPCYGTADLDAPSYTVYCGTSPTIGYDCHTTVWADAFGVHRDYVTCDPLLYCVTEPCPGGGTIRV